MQSWVQLVSSKQLPAINDDVQPEEHQNPNQDIAMRESEVMSLEQEPKENQIPMPGDDHESSQPELTGNAESESFVDVESEKTAHEASDALSCEPDTTQAKNSFGEGRYSAQFEALLQSFDQTSDSESKLQMAIDFMETSLAQGGTPHFRSFWEARRLCLPLFKDNINPATRGVLWGKYSELSKEARRLKEILDEQSAFAVEQIEIAIQALEAEVDHFDENLEKVSDSHPPMIPSSLCVHEELYHRLQKQLNLLNAQAARVNALRKELLKTEMRVKHKNKFFQRLSLVGDHVFPRRKDLIKQISQQFSDDVDQFIEKHFGSHPSQESLYALREEIKAMQSLAKVLTLNTHSFTQTRMLLSDCWDKIKTEEKERKKERAQQRAVYKQNFDTLEKEIDELKEALEKNEETGASAQKKVEGIALQMKRTELGRDEVRLLRESLGELRKLIHDRIKAGDEARQILEQEKERQKQEKIQVLRDQAERLVSEHEEISLEQLLSSRDSLQEEISASQLSKNEKQELEGILKPLRDIISDKQENALLALSEDDRHALQQLKSVLQQRKQRRQEIKDQLEVLRKTAGSSSLDFEKAMSCKVQINEEKERLEKANVAIQEIESKMAQLQAQLKAKS